MICPHCRRLLPSAAMQLRAAIDRARLSDAAAARRLGVPRQRLYEWLTALRTPRPERLAKLLTALAAPADRAPRRRRPRRAQSA